MIARKARTDELLELLGNVEDVAHNMQITIAELVVGDKPLSGPMAEHLAKNLTYMLRQIAAAAEHTTNIIINDLES